ncbi:MAG TPA: trypsin-like peptidase domain-containing protein [Leptolyngbyaceae cyanobacterium M33_DOE_097]|uniref:Trypsin-like serine protease n=1 Tax=Oscillatoriales cyanobacterium SpSt-418 TaxID=2282169 RepID=A0A7C3PFU9_9CYAN|nr:trypsin-like peptidase domain-containing protein [Leptolyngbyaceae cyanobacterium M33_DOE_097]
MLDRGAIAFEFSLIATRSAAFFQDVQPNWILAFMKLRSFLLILAILGTLGATRAWRQWPGGQVLPGNGKAESIAMDVCQAMRPAVVTIYAGSEIGAGSVINSTGLILTNHHVVQEVGNQPVRVKDATEKVHVGQVVATDSVNDLALVQIQPQTRFASVITLAKTDQLAGQPICAIGSPFNQAGIVTRGILTGNRENGDLKAAILLHPGNSGGPLLNQEGQLIGVNKAIWEDAQGQNSGISFATNLEITRQFIETNQAKAQNLPPLPIDQLTPEEAAAQTPTPATPAIAPNPVKLGITINQQTLIIRLVEPDSAAERAGLLPGDRLVAINQQPVSSFQEVEAVIAGRPATLTVTIERNRERRDFAVGF